MGTCNIIYYVILCNSCQHFQHCFSARCFSAFRSFSAKPASQHNTCASQLQEKSGKPSGGPAWMCSFIEARALWLHYDALEPWLIQHWHSNCRNCLIVCWKAASKSHAHSCWMWFCLCVIFFLKNVFSREITTAAVASFSTLPAACITVCWK